MTKTFVLPKDILQKVQIYREQGLYCDWSDIIDIGTQTCSYRVTSQTNTRDLYYKICSGLPCEFGKDWTGKTVCTLGATGSIAEGQTIYAPYGSVISFCSNSMPYSQTSYIIERKWPQKQLIRHTWTGYEAIVKATGCDIRAVLTSAEWAELPKNAKTSLEIDERVNFIDTFIDVPVLGNYIDSPIHGPVVCGAAGPPRPVYKLKLNVYATGPDESGKYETTNPAVCYYTTEANPVAYWQCCPGETLLGKACDNSGNWVDLDMGQCCRGGICTSALCPGGGTEYCDITTHKVSRFGCRESDGMCVDQTDRAVDCCPPSKGCAGDEFCNYMYQCEKKPTGVQACPGECCEGNAYYQNKACAGNKRCCMTASGVGNCLTSCAGVEPPVSPPTGEDVLACVEAAKRKFALNPLKPVIMPFYRIWCWVLSKKTNIVVGFVLGVMLALVLGLVMGPLGGIAGFTVGLVLALWNLWVGVILVILVFAGMLALLFIV